MAPKSTIFTEVLRELTQEWQNIIINNIKIGKQVGFINSNVEPKSIAIFIISSYWGIRNFGRMENENEVYRSHLKELKNYLNSLK